MVQDISISEKEKKPNNMQTVMNKYANREGRAFLHKQWL